MSAQVTVIPIGPGDPGRLTLEAAELLQSGQRLIFRTARHPVADWLRARQVEFTDFDALYDQFDDFEALHRAMAAELWQQAAKTPVLFAVADPTTDGAVQALWAQKPKTGRLTVLPGVTLAAESLCAQGEVSCVDGLRMLPATALTTGASLDPSLPLLLTELDSRMLAGEVKLALSDLYDDEQPVQLFTSQVETTGRVKTIPLWQLDMQRHYDHTVRVLLPAVDYLHRERCQVEDLRRIMAVLRGENGCPWDREQTHESLRPYLLEEAYEAAEAIDSGDDERLADELGDVLLQVVFHGAVGEAQGSFTLTDIATHICRKMVYRHPHVFASGEAGSAAEAFDSWEQLKKKEKHLTTTAEAMADVAHALPALLRAEKVQKKAAQTGFTWPDALAALQKVREETDELQEVLVSGGDPQEELGDLLLACTAVARLAGTQAEAALEKATEKYIRRFRLLEQLLVTDGKSLKDLTLDEMVVYWERVKQDAGLCQQPPARDTEEINPADD